VADREGRIGRNEALFREVNERIERVTQALQVGSDDLRILCECGDPTCFEHLDIALSEYERVRGEPTLFLLRPGHEYLEVEEVVEEHDGYVVVRKRDGEAIAQARELDPRRT
jgi:hypothetical protein